jgi:hypothetical protein
MRNNVSVLILLIILGLVGTVSAGTTWNHIETIQVPSIGPSAPDHITVPVSSSPLQKDVLYKVVVSGTYTYGSPASSVIADAEWTNRPSGAVPGLSVGTWYKGNTFEPWLDLMINENDIDWGNFQSDHIYSTLITGDGKALNFRIKDSCSIGGGEGCYNDNSGSLTVDIYADPEDPLPAPEFPSSILPLTMIIGFVGSVLFIQKTREH